MEKTEKKLLTHIAVTIVFLAFLLIMLMLAVKMKGFPYGELAATIIVCGLLWSVYAAVNGLMNMRIYFAAGGKTLRLAFLSILLNGFSTILLFVLANAY